MQTLNNKLNALVKSQHKLQKDRAFVQQEISQNIQTSLTTSELLSQHIPVCAETCPIATRTEQTYSEIQLLESQLEHVQSELAKTQTKVTVHNPVETEKSKLVIENEEDLLEQLMLKYEPEAYTAFIRKLNFSKTSTFQNSVLSEMSIMQQDPYKSCADYVEHHNNSQFSTMTMTAEEAKFMDVADYNFKLKKQLAVAKCNFREKRDAIQEIEGKVHYLIQEQEKYCSIAGIVREKLEIVKHEVEEIEF
ncbi:hypothetical protein SS50377_26541 [Spironucleus salmonicida]|uniref:Uncharacterized protein n=1 Tax=Spironucleus salmonicida TaxID=348837 RepID=V6LAC4_9EUKA|nr:hypothetical protein SS50377_26541 [Spironucleus salmonicida]|eukprot:EST41395.1 Hypothetical protein SS50377_19112 [Spironucleus salmonicida]